MADKKIQIDLKVAGGDQAAAEVKKVKPAVEAAAGSINAMEKEVVDATKAFKAAVAGTDEFVAASKRLEVAKTSLTEATKKVTASSFNMRSSIQNVGYQVQDLAVQIGSGTSAFVAFGQQAPQLLSGFGPVGIMLGTLAAVTLPLAGAMFKLGDETEGAGKKADATADKLQKLREKAANLAAEKSAEKLNAWLDSLDDEEQAILNQNAALERNLELIRMKRDAEAETEEARRDLEIARIEADSNKSEADKIAEVAAVRERSAKAAAQGKLDKLADSRRDASDDLRTDEQLAKDTLKQLRKAEAGKKRLEDEKNALEGKVTQAGYGKARILSIDDELKELGEREANTTRAAGPMGPDQSVMDGYQAKREELKREREEAELLANSVESRDAGRLGKIDAEIATVKDAIKNLKKETEAADKKVEDSRAKVTQAEEVQKIQAPAIIDRYSTDSQTRSIRTDAAVREAQKRAEKKAQDDADRKQRLDLEDQMERSGKGLDSEARGYGRQATAAGLKEGNKVLAQIGRDLSDGTNAAELQKIGDLMSEKFNELGEHNVSVLKGVIDKLREQSDRIQVMQEQIRNIGRRAR